uniref:LAM_G_DOMAIN domain-containing protein n=1 Tax=Caenorhabditis tropicalis TaxID=1561998 RepID=A0A1I7TUY6_9PELO
MNVRVGRDMCYKTMDCRVNWIQMFNIQKKKRICEEKNTKVRNKYISIQKNNRTKNIIRKQKRVSNGRPLSFRGSNYAEFPIRDNAYLETNITIQFKLDEHKDGIIFFGGELMGDDFLSITLDGPNIIMRHDCGEGTIEDMYHGKFGIGEWHEINVWRKNCDLTEMTIDGGHKLVDRADEFKNYKGITMDEGVFLGAAPHNIEFLQQKTGAFEGFRGCVRLLVVNGEVLLNTNETINKAYDSSANYYCGEEESKPERKQKKIVIIKDGKEIEDSDDVIQIEMFDLTQRGIPKIMETPGLHPSVYKLTTTTNPPLGHPILKELIVTQEPTKTTQTTPTPLKTSWKVAHFNGSSKIVVTAPDSILSYLELSIQFKAEKQNGVLFFWKEDSKFLIVTIENSFVKVYASLGVDATILRSENAVSLYHWHKLEVWRSGKGVLLKVNKQGWVESELHAARTEVLEGTGRIFIGSLDEQDIPTVMKDMEGFSGCVKRIRLNGRSISMQSIHATHVTECFTDPCTTYGCPKKCLAHNSMPICQCDWPMSGRKCTIATDPEISAMKFSGFSYMEVDNESVMSHITGDSLDMAVNFKIKNTTQNVRQIVVSAGDVTHEDDFFELCIDTNRFVRFALNLGSGTIVLTHPKRIEEERWVTVEVIRKKNLVKLSVNGEDPITGFAPEGAEQLNVYRNVFIGSNHIPEGTLDGRDYTGLEGCIISLRFDQTTISHPKQSRTAINIQDCSI